MGDPINISVTENTEEIQITVSESGGNVVLLSTSIEDIFVAVTTKDGLDGHSAYQLWLLEGNEGTIEDFLNSLTDKYFRYDQSTPATTWEITHNLKKRPSVTVTDSAGSVVEGSVEYIDENNLKITFSAAFSGYAELN